jgi:tetratricopeptide (TPR) repeat protein
MRAILVTGVLALLAGCVQEAEERRIDEHLMAALGQARALHHLADVHLAEGDPAKAEEAVERIFDVEFPAGAPERDDVVVDAYGRLAKIQLAQDRLDEAAATLQKGVGSVRRDTFYTASLHLIEGEIHEARSKKAREAGDEPSARAEARRAIEAYEESIAINERVMERIAREEKQDDP